MGWEVQYTTSRSGRAWVYRFLLKLDGQLRSRVICHLTAMEQHGLRFKPELIKKIRADIYELRIVGQEQVRIIFTVRNHTIILLHGFRKKDQKLRLKDIETALNRL